MGERARVLFDSNDGSDEGGWWLVLPQSLAELDAIPGGPQEGLPIRLYMPGELECDAILRFEDGAPEFVFGDRTGFWVGMRTGPWSYPACPA